MNTFSTLVSLESKQATNNTGGAMCGVFLTVVKVLWNVSLIVLRVLCGLFFPMSWCCIFSWTSVYCVWYDSHNHQSVACGMFPRVEGINMVCVSQSLGCSMQFICVLHIENFILQRVSDVIENIYVLGALLSK